jgi:hypothetical protein
MGMPLPEDGLSSAELKDLVLKPRGARAAVGSRAEHRRAPDTGSDRMQGPKSRRSCAALLILEIELPRRKLANVIGRSPGCGDHRGVN